MQQLKLRICYSVPEELHTKMFRKKSVTGEVMHDGRTAYDAILKATSMKTRGKEWEIIMLMNPR